MTTEHAATTPAPENSGTNEEEKPPPSGTPAHVAHRPSQMPVNAARHGALR
ncbi:MULTISPECIES: hypothetical protein [Streptomycetaceae]|uniref:hypothetical protein n=1 Tax=Streptomycetaceae TaxID=2062 RepID=UPI0002EBDCBA|nr:MULTISPECIES: hypothetical protein [Streptomycetaceae]MYS59218.1 hypothetical protein [Streptomyces sp. SID5468]